MMQGRQLWEVGSAICALINFAVHSDACYILRATITWRPCFEDTINKNDLKM
jgi:hypothetical protein